MELITLTPGSEPRRRAPLGTRMRSHEEDGFSLMETLIALFLLAVGLLSLAGVFTISLARMNTASWDILAKEKASETIENVLAARDAGRLTWDQINSVGVGTGIFVTGQRSLFTPGADRLVGTADDTATIETITRPGPNGNMGDADDQTIRLSAFTRQIEVLPVPPGNTLRELRVTIRYTMGGVSRTIQMSSYVSSFTG